MKVSGTDGIALTKVDVLDGLDELKVCVGYRLDGRMIDYLPAGQGAQARVEPIYEVLEGWKEFDRRRTVVGAVARAGDEIHPADGGADRGASDAAVHHPQARRHHPGAGPVRGLSAFSKYCWVCDCGLPGSQSVHVLIKFMRINAPTKNGGSGAFLSFIPRFRNVHRQLVYSAFFYL